MKAMPKSITLDNIESFGVSVTGPGNSEKGEKNQDALLVKSYKDFWISVVCDGVGSAAKSRQGAIWATQSVVEAAKIWVKSDPLDTRLLLRLIHNIWAIKVRSVGTPEHFATTCLFTLVQKNQRVIIGQLGDGLIIYKSPAGKYVYAIKDNKSYGNQTLGLGMSKSLSDWKIVDFVGIKRRDFIFMCTDGVSDDLKEGMEEKFGRALIRQYSNMLPVKRARELRKVLENWITEKHSDDKTICLAWVK
jgi:serine/threonine protein phosphatase PrpC